jgi:hypothetical protein
MLYSRGREMAEYVSPTIGEIGDDTSPGIVFGPICVAVAGVVILTVAIYDAVAFVNYGAAALTGVIAAAVYTVEVAID